MKSTYGWVAAVVLAATPALAQSGGAATTTRETTIQTSDGKTITFTGRLNDREVTSKFEGCRAFILPGEEDFGLTPLEANAAGRPAVAFARGGALDTVRDGETGVLFNEPTVESLADALRAVAARSWNPAALRAHAETFSESVFDTRFRAALTSAIESRTLGRLGADDDR